MSAGASTKWFWSDWLGDQEVRRLTPAERGVWIDMLALMAAAAPTGYLCDGKGNPISDGELARVANAGTPEEVRKLVAGILEKGVASRDRSGRLFNRRMVRDVTTARKKSEAGKLGGRVTAEKHWGKPSLPQHVPRHMPQQGCHAPLPYLKKESSSGTDSSERTGTAGKLRPARGPPPGEAAAVPSEPAGGDDGFRSLTASRRRHEMAEEELAAILAKPPNRRSMAEISAVLEHKRAQASARSQAAAEGRALTGHEHLLATSYLNGGRRP